VSLRITDVGDIDGTPRVILEGDRADVAVAGALYGEEVKVVSAAYLAQLEQLHSLVADAWDTFPDKELEQVLDDLEER
jgi:hypothetical protein